VTRKVLMLGPSLDVRGGITSVTQTWLASEALRGVEVIHVGTVGEGRRRQKAIQMVQAQGAFLQGLRKKPDLVHIHVANWLSFLRKLWYLQQARAAGLPVVLHIHGSQFADLHDKSEVGAALVRHAFQRAALVLALSEGARRSFDEWTGGRARTEVLYNPVVLDGVGTGRPLAEPPVILFMGLIGDRKGVFDLVAVIPEILAVAPGTRFVFGGNGEVDRLRAAIAAAGVEGSCEVLGWVAGADKVRAFERASIYCLPSYREGLPVSVLEAMAAGLPVVSTAIAGTPEAVADGETGFLVEPGDRGALAERLVRLARDASLRASMGQAGRSLAEARFGSEAIAGRLRDLWESLFPG
jgi:glycosyltransferase involved in cell wall biosynthesis